MFIEILLTIFGLITLIYLMINKNYKHWQNQGITSIPAVFPYGSLKQCLLMRRTIGETLAEFYSKNDGQKLIGFYAPLEPMLLIRDPELIKTVLVKEFNNFHDNGFFMSKTVDPLLGNNPFAIRGLQEWKRVRGIHTPTHSLARLRNMVPDIVKVAENFAEYIGRRNCEPVEMKTVSRYFTVDSVAICAFGIESDSFLGGNSSLKEYTQGQLFGTSSEGNYACLSGLFLPSFVGKIFRWRTMSQNVENFFINLAHSCINHRICKCIRRNDLIQHLMLLNDKAKVDKKKPFTDAELAANCMTFFIDGVETSSVSLTFTLFEIAANLDIQKKLREEIKSVVKKSVEIDFDKLWSLTYLDMVISETLRKYPPVNLLSRVCVQETTLNGIKIKSGTKVFIPTLGLHMDPEYYPNPKKFEPERFSNEKQTSSTNKLIFLPFGEGPRICVGYKFALTQIKMAIIAIILKFRLSLPEDDKLKNALELDENSTFLISPKGDVNIIFTPI